MVEWYNKVKIDAELSEYLQVKRFAIRNKINIERSNTSTIRQWIWNIKEIKRKSEWIPKSNIRMFL